MKQNDRLVSYILKHIPSNVKKAIYLGELLDLSDESVYRRLRGEVAFTVEELFKLSRQLGFSIDEVATEDVSNKQAIFSMRADSSLSPHETFINILTDYCKDVEMEKNAINRTGLISLNHIILPLTFYYENLFKFNYYKWIHQSQDVPLNFSFSEITIPSDVNTLRIEAKELSDSVNNTTFILDQNMYLHTIKDIQYYYQRGLISREELQLIQDELTMMVEQTEKTVLKGVNRLGKSRYYYLSPLNIKSNIILVEYDNNIISHLWYHSITPISTTNEKLCSTYKQWLNSLKKYSSLITQSNDILSAKFFNEQRKYIREMDSID